MSMAEYAARRRAVEAARETGLLAVIESIRAAVTHAIVEGLERDPLMPGWGLDPEASPARGILSNLPADAVAWALEPGARLDESEERSALGTYQRLLGLLSPDLGRPNLAAVRKAAPPRHTFPGTVEALADVEGFLYLSDTLPLLVDLALASWRFSGRMDDLIGYSTRDTRTVSGVVELAPEVADPVGYSEARAASRSRRSR